MRLPKGVRKHGNRYEFRAVVNERRVTLQLGEDRAEAVRLGKLKREEIVRQRKEQRPASGSFGEFAERWFREYVPRERIERDHKKTRYRLNTFILPVLGKLQLSEVKGCHLMDVRAATEKAGRSAGTVRHVLNDARCVFSYAAELDLLETSPFNGKKNILPPPPEPEPNPLSDVELARVLGALKEPYRSTAILAVRTGCRWSEMRDLVWRDVTFGDKPNILLRHTKNGRWRRTRLDRQALAVVTEWHEEARGENDHPPGDDFVLPWRPEGPRWAADSTRRVLKPFTWKWKQLRSTAGTRWLREGTPLVVVSKRLGHRNVLVTTGHYADVSEDMLWQGFDDDSGPNVGQTNPPDRAKLLRRN